MIIKIRFIRGSLKKEKLISFECGFNSFFCPRVSFSIQFFKILLVFLFFDMEIVVVLPLIFIKIFSLLSLILIILIMLILLIGLYIEFKEGSLKWLK